jgi:hypothetical protein
MKAQTKDQAFKRCSYPALGHNSNTSISSTGAPDDECIHIPEPLFFDLVRGLDSKKGDAEINVLSSLNPSNGTFSVAPEFEISIKDGTAIEFELPTQDLNLSGYKFGVQQRILNKKKLIGGIQGFYETNKGLNEHEIYILPILGTKLSKKVSFLSVSGLAVHLQEKYITPKLIANGTLFYELNSKTVLGLEINHSNDLKDSNKKRNLEMRILPQIHRRIGKDYGLQIGAGVELSDGIINPIIAIRLIREFHFRF